jgi:hypothetical protein
LTVLAADSQTVDGLANAGRDVWKLQLSPSFF